MPAIQVLSKRKIFAKRRSPFSLELRYIVSSDTELVDLFAIHLPNILVIGMDIVVNGVAIVD